MVWVAGASFWRRAYGIDAVFCAYGVAEFMVVDVALVPRAAHPDHAEVRPGPVSCRHVTRVFH